MTVLVVPHRPAVDQFAEDDFYFEMSADEALAGDMDVRWAEIYDRCEAFTVRDARRRRPHVPPQTSP